MKIATATLISLLIPATAGFSADVAKSSAAVALLRGVALARSKYDNLRVEFVMEYADRVKRCTIPCLVEQADQQRRFEQFVGSCPQKGIVTLVDGLVVRSYQRKENADLEIYEMDRAVHVKGDVAFDPRVLGLDSNPAAADSTIETFLWIDSSSRIELVGREDLKGAFTWRVKTERENATADYWIEEPLFRVHKRVAGSYGVRIEIDSEFDPTGRTSPFPKRVEITREDRNGWKQLVVAVKSFKSDKSIPPGRFTMKSIDLPMNTMVNDYRINRITGYWDGEGISKEPVYPGQQPAKLPSSPLLSLQA